jgi:hypothetical protein
MDMMLKTRINSNRVILAGAAFALLTACAPTIHQAQEKQINIEGKSFQFGGTYNVDEKLLKLTVNGEPLMQGRFPPFTPTQNFNTTYQDTPFFVHCYFGSVLSSEGGAVGLVAGVIQAAKSSSADKCEISHKDVVKDTLYF